MSRLRILIAEDEISAAREVKDCLERLGYSVANVVTSGQTAVKKVAELRPNLILMNIRLNSRINGSSAAEHIYNRYNTPVIYLTSSADDELMQRNKLAEPYGHVVKPFEERELYKAIEIALYKHQMEQEQKQYQNHLEALMGERMAERKRAEETLQTLEANLRAIFDNSLQAFVLIDKDGKVQAFNKTASGGIKLVLGKDIKVGDSIFDFANEAWLDEFSSGFNRVLNGESISIEQNVSIKNADYWFELNFNPVIADDNRVIGVCFSTINIDNRNRITDALVASEDHLLAELQSVLFITSALVSETNLNKLLDLITTQAKYLLDVSGAMVLLLSDDSQYLTITVPGTSQLRIDSGSRIPVQGSLAGLAIASQQVQIINHASIDDCAPFIRVFLEPVKPGSLLCAPLTTQNNTLGVLLMWSNREMAFTSHQHHLMSLFVDQAALGLYNSYLHTQNRQLTILQERQRLARELHDSVTQSLHSIGLAADASLIYLDQNADLDQVRNPLEHIHILSKTELANLREHLYHLHPTVFEQEDLVEALARHCDQLSTLYGLEIVFKANPESTLSVSQRQALYFIIREALWNVVKHAEASHVNVVLAREEDQIVAHVEDDGVGFDPLMSANDGTMGLRSMKERAMLLGGKVELKSQVGKVLDALYGYLFNLLKGMIK